MPWVIPAVAIAATVASTAVSVVGAQQQAHAQSANADYQAQVAKNNAITAQQNATLATQQADAKAQADNRATAIRLGAQRAAMGANGIDLDSGSAAAVQANTTEYGALQASQDIYTGQVNAYSDQTQSTNYTAQAGLDTAQAGQAQTAGSIGAASSILSGASSFASKWNQYGYGGTGAAPTVAA